MGLHNGTSGRNGKRLDDEDGPHLCWAGCGADSGLQGDPFTQCSGKRKPQEETLAGCPQGLGGGVTTKKQIELAVLYLDGSRAGAGHSTAIICQNSQICKPKVRINKDPK